MEKSKLNTLEDQEKKILYPNNILQCVLLLLISIIISTPIILLKDSMSLAYFCTLIFILVYSLYIFLTAIINRIRGIRLHLNYKIEFNKSFLFSSLVMIVFQAGIYIPLIKLTSIISTSPTSLATNPFNPPLLLLGAILLAPIFEETIFRGLMLKGLLQNNTPTRAIIISAAIYASINMCLVHLFGSFCLGIILGHEFYRNRSLRNTIILNIIASILMTSSYFLIYKIHIEITELSIIALISSMLISSIVLFMIIRRFPCSKTNQE